MVVVGGELTLEMLDLTFNPISKFYEAPIQMKANGGVFVVDDFGRQRIPPRDLLNRWIVPLESRVDFLTLHTGRKFDVPFNVLIVFATNLKPESLADEAFLRRIPYKILAKNPTMDEYCRIFEMNCKKRNLAFDPVMVEYLHRKYYQPRKLQMRACHPRDLVEQVVNMCRYQNREPVDHARAARRGVRQLFPRRDRVPGGRADEVVAAVAAKLPARAADTRPSQSGLLAVSQPRCRAAVPRHWARSRRGWSIVALFTFMAVRLGADFLQTGRFTGLLLLASEALVVVLTVFRRPTGIVDRSLRARVLTTAVADWSAARRPDGRPGRSCRRPSTVMIVGVRARRRHRRQGVARPQLRPDARQPRRRVDRAVPPRAPSDLHGLPDHARRRSSPRTRRSGT